MWFVRLFTPLILAGFLIPPTLTGPHPVVSPEEHRADDGQKDRLELGKTLWICRVQKPGEVPQDFVTLLPTKETFKHGLIPEAIVGVLKSPLNEGEAIKPENFARNKLFNDFMHEFISSHGPKLKSLQAAARRQGEGWVYLIDGRTATPQGKVPPQDIFGAFEVKAGLLVAQSYKRNQRHSLSSADGFFQLPPELLEGLVKELTVRNSKVKKEGDGPHSK